MELKIDTTHEDDGVVVRLGGELDMLSAPDLSDELANLLDAGNRRLVVDLTELQFVDSSGLSALLGAHQKAESLGATLVLKSPNQRIIRLVSITGLGDVFEISAQHGEDPAGSH